MSGQFQGFLYFIKIKLKLYLVILILERSRFKLLLGKNILLMKEKFLTSIKYKLVV